MLLALMTVIGLGTSMITQPAQAATTTATVATNFLTSDSPAVVFFNDINQYVMVWKGAGSDQYIYYATSADGVAWANHGLTSPDRGTSIAPALVLYNSKLYMVWKGVYDDQRLFYSYFNGSTWSPQQWIPTVGGSSATPALAVYQGKIYMAWKGMYDDQRMFYTTFDGNTWAPQIWIPNQWTSTGPALSAYGSQTLVMAWKGMDTDQRIWWSMINPVISYSWIPQQIVPGCTSNSPTFAKTGTSFGGYLYWKGMSDDTRVFTVPFIYSGAAGYQGFWWDGPQSYTGLSGATGSPAVVEDRWTDKGITYYSSLILWRQSDGRIAGYKGYSTS